MRSPKGETGLRHARTARCTDSQRYPEIRNESLVFVKQDILGLYVAMNDALLVSRFERARHFARDPDRMDDACEKVLGKLANEPLLGIFPLEVAKEIGLHRVRVDVCLSTCEERGLIAIGKGDNKQRSCSVTEAGQQYLLRHGLV